MRLQYGQSTAAMMTNIFLFLYQLVSTVCLFVVVCFYLPVIPIVLLLSVDQLEMIRCFLCFRI